MLSLNFFGQNIHFAISLFAALVFFAVFWLYFDAWLVKRKYKEVFEWAGYLLVAVSFVVYSTVTEQSILGSSSLGNASKTVSLVLVILGFASVIIGQLIDPLTVKPKLKGLDRKLYAAPKTKTEEPEQANSEKQHTVKAVGFGVLYNPIHFLPPAGALAIAYLYWRRATTGLERHLKPVAIAFVFIFAFELLSLADLLRDTTNPSISKIVAPFGVLWFVSYAFLLVGIIIIGKWVWQYLTERFISQLFMIFTTLTLVIFLITSVSFTFLLVNNVQKSTLNDLETAASVLNYAVDSKKATIVANAETIAENPSVVAAVQAKDHNALVSLTNTYLATKKQTSLVITSDSGEVLQRAEAPNRYGDSLSSDTLLQRALIGQPASSVSAKDGVLAPLIYIRSATPIYNAQHQVVGAVIGSLAIDNAFADGIKQATGLDSSVYAGNVLSATTLLAPDGVSRSIGIKETNNNVQTTVLKNGKTFKGAVNVLNRHFLVAYVPLKDVDDTSVGMLFIGKPQDAVLKTAGRSIELTFIITAIMLMISILPAYLVARSIAKQVS